MSDARDRLRRLLEQRAAEGAPLFPLSYNQGSLWYLHSYDPSTSAYSVGFAGRTRSPLDADRLDAALSALAERHPGLRTSFRAVGGRALQQVHPMPTLRLERVEVGEGELAARVQADYERPFDLTQPPGMRAVLYRLAPQDHVLLLVVHHTLLDLWSLSLVLLELGALYEGGASLPDLPADYSTFVRWQSELLDDKAQRLYWEEELAGATTVLNLPTDRPRPPLQVLRGDSLSFTLDPALTAALNGLAREERASSYALLLAAFQVLLARYTDQDDVLVGSPVAGRSRADFEGVVGHFVNMIVLRGRLDGEASFRSYLRSVRDSVLGALEHQDYPFAALVEALGIPRDASRSPIFQACFAFQRAPKLEGLTGFLVRAEGAPPLSVGGIEFEPFPLSQQQGQFDLSLWMAEAEGSLHGELKFNTALHDRATAERMVEHYKVLLAGIASSPDAPLASLPLLPEDERALVVDEWNDTAAPWSGELCMHQLFERRVDESPELPAVECGSASMTYAELEAAANRVANHLRSLGVGRGSLVAVFLERGIDMVPTVLGIQKAGAGYVPLETHWPAARLEVILSSLPIRWVVCDPEHVELLSGLDVPLLDHVLTMSAFEGAPAARPAPLSTSDDTAYIIFTSGSTGTPKGVEVAHRPAINLIEWVNSTFDVGSGDRLLFVTSLCFDLSVYDIFGSLAAGATVVVATGDDQRDPDRLVRLLVDEGITFWDSAPPALAQLVPSLPDGPVDSPLRLVFLSGDWVPLRLPEQMRAVFPGAEVISLGGATEATIWSNWFPIPPVLEPQWVSIPYGKPIANARYYVLDPALQPCPVGVPGDLYIGGDCLAKGYVNDPDLTGAKFVSDPFVDRPDARMYRTGDRARFFPDGNIEFLGRQDFQVKIRGYRIELGEIESVLSQHPAVGDCLVMARSDNGPDKFLVAYAVVEGEAPSVSEVRAFLKERLPEYMVPPYVVFLDRLPITSNGKVDRKALPAPAVRRDEVGGEYVAPRTEVEARLADIWAKVLGADRVGVTDNFFDLGGHSLRAVQVMAEVESVFGVRLPVSALLQSPTVADLAGALSSSDSLLVTLRDDGGAVLFLLHPSGGEVLSYRELAGALEGWTVIGVRTGMHLGVDEMADAYAAEILSSGRGGPYRLLGWSLGGVLAQAVALRLEAAGHEVAFCGIVDSALPALHPELLEGEWFRLSERFGSLASLFAALPAAERAEVVESIDSPAAAIAWAKGRGLLPEDTPDEALLRQVDASRRHDAALRSYKPAGQVRVPLTVWWAEESGRFAVDWSAWSATGATVVGTVRGNHYDAVTDPANAAAIAAHVSST